MNWIFVFLLIVGIVVTIVWLNKLWGLFENVEEIKRILSEKENNKN